MSRAVITPNSSIRPGIVRSVVIATVAAFALGALTAFASKLAYSNPNAPVAASGAAPLSM